MDVKKSSKSSFFQTQCTSSLWVKNCSNQCQSIELVMIYMTVTSPVRSNVTWPQLVGIRIYFPCKCIRRSHFEQNIFKNSTSISVSMKKFDMKINEELNLHIIDCALQKFDFVIWRHLQWLFFQLESSYIHITMKIY